MMYVIMSETSIKTDSLRTGQESAFQYSLFRPYANFSKLMPTIHTSMTRTFQCEYCQCSTFKTCNKIHTITTYY